MRPQPHRRQEAVEARTDAASGCRCFGLHELTGRCSRLHTSLPNFTGWDVSSSNTVTLSALGLGVVKGPACCGSLPVTPADHSPVAKDVSL